MNNIKYRAWDNAYKGIREVLVLDLAHDEVTFADGFGRSLLSVTLLPSTGVRDSRGEEIFEGDLVRTKEGNVREVVYDTGCYWLKDAARRYAFPLSMTVDSTDGAVKIIGNAYEHRHLLKAQ